MITPGSVVPYDPAYPPRSGSPSERTEAELDTESDGERTAILWLYPLGTVKYPVFAKYVLSGYSGDSFDNVRDVTGWGVTPQVL